MFSVKYENGLLSSANYALRLEKFSIWKIAAISRLLTYIEKTNFMYMQ